MTRTVGPFPRQGVAVARKSTVHPGATAAYCVRPRERGSVLQGMQNVVVDHGPARALRQTQDVLGMLSSNLSTGPSDQRFTLHQVTCAVPALLT